MQSEWVSVPLEDLADDITVGFVGSMATEYRETGIPFLRTLNLMPLRILKDDLKFVSPEFHARIKKSALSPGDVVIARTGKPGACAVIPGWLPDANCSDLVIVRCGPRLNNHFLAYYVNTVAGQHIAAHTVGAVQQHFNVGSARTMKIFLPPLADQEEIVQTLRALDNKITLLRNTNTTLESIAKALFKSWFVDFDPVRAKADGRDPEGVPPDIADLFPGEFRDSELGAIPKGWRIASIKDVASDIQYGFTQSASTDPVGPRFLRITDIQGGKVEWDKVPFCEVTKKEYAKYKIMAHDILVARTGASTGENIYLPVAPDAVFASYLVRFQFSDQGIARLVGAFMRTSRYFDYVAACRGGSAQPNASAQALAGARMVVPEVKVAHQFAKLIAPMDDSIVANQERINSLAELRDTLVPRLMSGKLRIPDVEEIPA